MTNPLGQRLTVHESLLSGANNDEVLTPLARGAGCGCKLDKALLLSALADLPVPADRDIIVGADRLDDAAVYRLTPDLAVVASVDFFTPIVDDPAKFGAIAATNALSDLYAMGASPTFGLAVCAYPKEADPKGLRELLRGGARAAISQGCPVLGGHTIDDPEPKYGLAVLGTAHPDHLLTNAAAQAGDALMLTKPIGVGVVATARRAGAASEPVLEAAEASMLQSNRAAAEAALEAGCKAATDVTGFGLLGHAEELAAASGVGVALLADRVPMLPGAFDLAAEGHLSGGLRRNSEFARRFAETGGGVSGTTMGLLCDPQTSGGLLIAVDPGRRIALTEALARRGARAWQIGHVVDVCVGDARVHVS